MTGQELEKTGPTQPATRSRTWERDFTIWRQYTAGLTMDELAARFDLSTSRIQQIIAFMRDDVPIEERRARQRRQLEELDRLRQQAHDLIDRDPIPAYSNGRPIEMADGTIAEDHAGRVKAMELLLRVQEREAKALGTDKPVKQEVEHTGGVEYRIVGVNPDALS